MADEQPEEVDAEDDGENDDGGDDPRQGDGEIWYINTDLDVQAGAELDIRPLVGDLEARQVSPLTPEQYRLTETGWLVVFETDKTFREPDPNIAMMLDAIESLDPTSAGLWRACTVRELNIGYDCGDRPWAFNQGIGNVTLARMAAAGLTLRFTLYPPDKPSLRPHAGGCAPGSWRIAKTVMKCEPSK